MNTNITDYLLEINTNPAMLSRHILSQGDTAKEFGLSASDVELLKKNCLQEVNKLTGYRQDETKGTMISFF